MSKHWFVYTTNKSLLIHIIIHTVCVVLHIYIIYTCAQGFSIMWAEESDGFQLFSATASLYLIGTYNGSSLFSVIRQ